MNTAPQAVVGKKTLMPHRMKEATYERQVYLIVPPEDHTFEDVLQPTYWSHIANRLRPGDHLEVMPDNSAYWAELLVVSVDNFSARVQAINSMLIDANTVQGPEAADPLYRVMYRGPHHKWCVERISDGQRVRSELGSKSAAFDEMRALMRQAA